MAKRGPFQVNLHPGSVELPTTAARARLPFDNYPLAVDVDHLATSSGTEARNQSQGEQGQLSACKGQHKPEPEAGKGDGYAQADRGKTREEPRRPTGCQGSIRPYFNAARHGLMVAAGAAQPPTRALTAAPLDSLDRNGRHLAILRGAKPPPPGLTENQLHSGGNGVGPVAARISIYHVLPAAATG